jgi:hypothetical protein
MKAETMQDRLIKRYEKEQNPIKTKDVSIYKVPKGRLGQAEYKTPIKDKRNPEDDFYTKFYNENIIYTELWDFLEMKSDRKALKNNEPFIRTETNLQFLLEDFADNLGIKVLDGIKDDISGRHLGVAFFGCGFANYERVPRKIKNLGYTMLHFLQDVIGKEFVKKYPKIANDMTATGNGILAVIGQSEQIKILCLNFGKRFLEKYGYITDAQLGKIMVVSRLN